MTHPAVGKRCIIRTQSSGVHLGTIEAVSNGGMFSRATVRDARRIWQWRGAFTLSEVATNGIDSGESRVACNVPEHYLEDCIEFIPATDEAIKSIEAATSKL